MNAPQNPYSPPSEADDAHRSQQTTTRTFVETVSFRVSVTSLFVHCALNFIAIVDLVNTRGPSPMPFIAMALYYAPFLLFLGIGSALLTSYKFKAKLIVLHVVAASLGLPLSVLIEFVQ